MCKFRVLLLCFAVGAVHFRHVYCLSDEDKKILHDGLESIAHDCLHGCGIDEKETENFQSDGSLDQCFRNCFMTDAGFLDVDGKYNKDILSESLTKVTGNQDNAERILNELDRCFTENGDNSEMSEEAHMKRVDILFACLREIKETLSRQNGGTNQDENWLQVIWPEQCLRPPPTDKNDSNCI